MTKKLNFPRASIITDATKKNKDNTEKVRLLQSNNLSKKDLKGLTPALEGFVPAIKNYNKSENDK